MTTYAECNIAEVATVTVDTEMLILDATIPAGKGGRIKQIRFSCITATSAPGYLELKLGNHTGPFRFAVGPHDAVTALTLVIDCDIEVIANETVKGYATLNIGGTEATMGIIWVG